MNAAHVTCCHAPIPFRYLTSVSFIIKKKLAFLKTLFPEGMQHSLNCSRLNAPWWMISAMTSE